MQSPVWCVSSLALTGLLFKQRYLSWYSETKLWSPCLLSTEPRLGGVLSSSYYSWIWVGSLSEYKQVIGLEVFKYQIQSLDTVCDNNKIPFISIMTVYCLCVLVILNSTVDPMSPNRKGACLAFSSGCITHRQKRFHFLIRQNSFIIPWSFFSFSIWDFEVRKQSQNSHTQEFSYSPLYTRD